MNENEFYALARAVENNTDSVLLLRAEFEKMNAAGKQRTEMLKAMNLMLAHIASSVEAQDLRIANQDVRICRNELRLKALEDKS